MSLLLVTIGLASPAVAGQRAGDLDVTFGVGGKVVHPGFVFVEDVVVQPDGKILVVGNSADEVNETLNIRIARYHADGSADDSFGTGGVVETDFDGLTDEARAAAVQPDGKIVVVGKHGYEIWCCEYFYDLIAVRYEPDGSLDTSFGDGGKVIADFGKETDLGTDVAIQADGKIVVAAFSGSQGIGQADFVVARYHADGTPDTGFGLGGRTTTDFPDPYFHDAAESMVIQADGKILLGGSTGRDVFGGGVFFDYALARYLPDGTLDSGFGEAGLVITDVGTANDAASAVELQTDGKIILAGVTAESQNVLFALVRYLEDGSLDSSFGAGGVVRNDVGDYESVGDVAIQADGKILVAGGGGPLTQQDFVLLRYTPDGRLDRSFGLNGRVRTDFQPLDDATSLAIQVDGKIVVAGDHLGFLANGLIARYHSEGDVRPDVKANGADGVVVVSPGDAIRVTISLDPGPRAGEYAAWWLLAETPSGLLTYDFESRTWVPGAFPGYLGPLVSFSDRSVLAGPAPPAGSVILYFGVQVREGSPELPYYDEVRVTVASLSAASAGRSPSP
jgi:uncharacterized delta-60 repeat protein